MERAEIAVLFEKYIKKLRITPAWDVRLEFVEDPTWRKTGDFKIDCDDRKAILIQSLMRLKNNLIAQGRYTDGVDDVLCKVLSAKKRKFKIKYI